ncbi:hypothetical protein Lal_00036232 [Lupinus albus]|nr:hypothetical protein Lal_00036232 [Lupinus albus]
MERHKLIYFNKFLELGDINFESLVIHVEEAEPNVRRSYADNLDLTEEELVNIILVDSCIIIELFWRFYYNEWVPFDIRLLNQDAYTLKDIFIGPFHQHNPRLQNMERHKLIYFNKFLELGDVNLESLVIHVEEAEPNLRRSYADTLDLTKEELEKIILVEDGTKLLIHNLVALEQCHYPYESYITNYVAILDFHINSNRDVDALIENDSWKPRLSKRFSPERERITWEGEILGYTGGFSPERELSRLGEKWQFWAVDTDNMVTCSYGRYNSGKPITGLGIAVISNTGCCYLLDAPRMNYKDAVNNIKGMLERAESPITGHCCIYRVPFDIRLLNQNAYTLKDISIGPFHHHNPRLQNMERHKLIYFNKFLELGDVNLESLVIHVEEVEPSLRRSYADTLDLIKEELVKIILVDSCFIIEFFERFYYNEWSKGDAFLLKPWLTNKIRLDLVLIENQLPFFVLESLYNRALISGSAIPNTGYCLLTRRSRMNYQDVVNDIKGMLEKAELPLTGDCFFYRVPFDIRLLNQDAYTPKVVSIGPFHHHNPRLQNMERHKLIYLNKFLELGDRFQTLDVFYLLNAPTMNYKDVVDDIKGMLERAESLITGDCCISSVPFDIRLLN